MVGQVVAVIVYFDFLNAMVHPVSETLKLLLHVLVLRRPVVKSESQIAYLSAHGLIIL